MTSSCCYSTQGVEHQVHSGEYKYLLLWTTAQPSEKTDIKSICAFYAAMQILQLRRNRDFFGGKVALYLNLYLISQDFQNSEKNYHLVPKLDV